MKKFLLGMVMSVILLLPAQCLAAAGIIRYVDDTVIVIADEYENLYCGEVYSLTFAERYDIVGGDFDVPGYWDLYNVTKDETISVLIEETYLTPVEAADWLADRLGL